MNRELLMKKSTHFKRTTAEIFHPNTDTVEIQVDVSSTGLGACLMQGGQPVQYASRAHLQKLKNVTAKLRKRCSVLYLASPDSIPTRMAEK